MFRIPFGRVILTTSLLLTPLVVQANLALESQRETFLAAEKAADKRQYKRYRQLRDSLKEYPLHPYLVYRDLLGNLSGSEDEEIAKFLDRNDDSPLVDRLRRKLLPKVAGKGQWTRYLRFYADTDDAKTQCNYLRALIETGEREKALDQVPELWLHGKSQPSECDPVFKAWRQAKRLTPELVWGRIELAFREKGGDKLAKYLGRYLPKQDKPLLDLWLQVHQNPSLVRKGSLFQTESPVREKILAHGVWRQTRGKNIQPAVESWKLLKPTYEFSDEQIARVEQRIGLKLLWQDQPNALSWLRNVEPQHLSEKLLDTGVREAVGLQDWQSLAALLKPLVPDSLNEYQRYWLGRSLEHLGETEAAKSVLSSLAKERTYHGFLAADRVGLPYNLANIPLQPNQLVLSQVENMPAVQRARELFALGRMVDARREWYKLVKQLDIPQQKAFSKIAQGWGWHSRAIFTLAKTDYWDDLDLRFPLQHSDTILSVADRRDLDKSWVYAVVRQESAFIPDARSPSGAMGLMQLMPATAREVAGKLRLKRPGRSELLNPEFNVTLGTSYLRQMLERLNQHPILATAAYNAGPHRVNKWLPENSIPAEEWVATIPFDETRGYVERIMSYTVIYDTRLGQPARHLSDSMMLPVGRNLEVSALIRHKSDAG
jgi:soluble lytic murein transglycosylase